MAIKHRRYSQTGSSTLIIGIALAGLIGLAYLANNTIGSKANVALPTSTNVQDYTLPRSPYPECQDELDAANQKIVNDSHYKALLDELGRLLKEAEQVRRQIDELIRQGKGNTNEAIGLKWKLFALQAEIKQAQIRANEYRSIIFAEYDACVLRAIHNRRPGLWWQRMFSLTPIPTATPSSPTRAR